MSTKPLQFARQADKDRFLEVARTTTFDEQGKNNLLRGLDHADRDENRIIDEREADTFFRAVSSYQGDSGWTGPPPTGRIMYSYSKLVGVVDKIADFEARCSAAYRALGKHAEQLTTLLNESCFAHSGQKALLDGVARLPTGPDGVVESKLAQLFFRWVGDYQRSGAGQKDVIVNVTTGKASYSYRGFAAYVARQVSSPMTRIELTPVQNAYLSRGALAR